MNKLVIWLCRRFRVVDWYFDRRLRRAPSICSCGNRIVGGQVMYIDPRTLARRYRVLCRECADDLRSSPQQQRLREERTRKDWTEITAPINVSAIRADEMPEQYPGRVRDALRAFVASTSKRAVVPGVDMASLQQAIGSLGLTGEVYAEQRGNQTVLRRIGAATERGRA